MLIYKFFYRKYISVFLFAGLLVLSGTFGAHAQEQAQENTAVLPIKPTRTIEFTTDEGTWISLDVSRDGKTVLFELLGDLYTVPIEGGGASRLTSGMAFDSQPSYSPNGEHIVFISDRSGSENVWITRTDGSEPVRLSSDRQSQFASPSWTQDGEYVIVTRLGAGNDMWDRSEEIWMYHISGGNGVQITNNDNSSYAMGPIASPDGHYLYYAKRSFRPWLEMDYRLASSQIVRRDRTTGAEEVITEAGEYHSHNTHKLNEVELTDLLINLREIKGDIDEFKKNG